MEINVTFEEYDEVVQYDLEDVLNELGINENWESRNQVTIDQRKKQLEQQLLSSEECICEYNKLERVLHKCSQDQMELHNLAWYERNLATELQQKKQLPAEWEKYQVYQNMNEEYGSSENKSSLATKSWQLIDTKRKEKQ